MWVEKIEEGDERIISLRIHFLKSNESRSPVHLPVANLAPHFNTCCVAIFPQQENMSLTASCVSILHMLSVTSMILLTSQEQSEVL